MRLYLDPSALVKRYVAEPASDLVRQTMAQAEEWFICRVGYVEVVRALGLTGGNPAARAFREEWGAFGVVAVDKDLVEAAAELTRGHDLRSLDALHMAAALLVQDRDLVIATWDRRLHAAAREKGIGIVPERLG